MLRKGRKPAVGSDCSMLDAIPFRLTTRSEKYSDKRSPLSVRLLLADDYEPWRRCVSSLLLRHPEWRVVCEVSDGLEAVSKAQEVHPDLILLDLSLPRLGGVEAASRIRQTTPGMKILFITAYQDSDAMQTVLQNRAEGYVLKWEITRELIPAIEAVLSGGTFVSAKLTSSPE